MIILIYAVFATVLYRVYKKFTLFPIVHVRMML